MNMHSRCDLKGVQQIFSMLQKEIVNGGDLEHVSEDVAAAQAELDNFNKSMEMNKGK